MKKHVFITALLLWIAVSFVKAVPLNGTYTIDNTAPTAGTNFNNFTDAVNALNTDGVSGPVVFNVTAGQLWALTCGASPNNYGLKITATGTATNTITFQKSGVGSNPLLNITGTSATTDMGIWLSGASYITFDGIDITDVGTASANFLDYGFYLRGISTTVGCIRNVYQNGTITLHRTNATAYGVFVDGAANTAGTSANKYNKFYNNTIINAFQGYRLNGASSTAMTNRDFGTEIGTINGGRSQVLATGSTTVATLSYGIYAQHQDSISIFNTLVDSVQTNNTSFPGATGIYCINISNVKIYNDTIRNITGPVQAVGLNFETENGDNSIYGNLVENVILTTATAGSNNIMRLYSTGTLGTVFKLNVYNNTIRNCGATLSASPIEGMYFGSLSAAGMQIYCYNNTIKGLYLSRTTNHTGTIEGIFLSTSATCYFYNNILSDFTNGYGTSAPGVRGITINAQSGVANVYNNTLYFDAGNPQIAGNTSFASACLYVASAANPINLRNNIFVNKNNVTIGARAVAFWGTGTSYSALQSTTNNNLYYAGTPGTKNLLFYDATNSIQTLAAYKTLLVNKDQAAYTEDVPFVNGTTAPFDLHISAGTPTQVESGALFVPEVVADYDGNIRNLVTPDLGAFEFVGQLLDLSPPVISYTALPNTNISGPRTLKVCIKDLSGVPTSGAGTPVLYWNINSGVYTGVAGTYLSNDTFSFSFGAGTVPGNTVGYYIVAQDNVGMPNIGSFPADWNGIFSSYPPTAGSTPPSVSSYILLGTIPAGIYSVGVGGTYTTLTAAMTAYNLMALGGTIVFELTDATYPSETYPIVIGNNLTANAINTLTIRPAGFISAPIVFGASSTTAIFDMNGAKYVTIDGRPGGATGSAQYIALQNTSTAGNTIILRNEASNNNLIYLNVTSANTVAGTLAAAVTTGSIPGAIVIGNTTGSNGNDFNTISNCDIHSTGTTLGAGIYAGNNTAAGTAANNDSNIIANNNIYDYFLASSVSAGIDIALGNNKFVISDNKLYQTAARTYSGTAIQRSILVGPYASAVPTAGSGFVINNNTIGYGSVSGTGVYTIGGTTGWLWCGMDLTMGTGTATSVQGNIITEVSVLSNGNGGSTAFIGYQVNNGNVNFGTVTGNILGSTTTNSSILFNATTTNGGLIGIRTAGTGTINIANNTVSGVTLTGNTTSIVPIFNGIAAGSGPVIHITNNTIGSSTLANSIYLPTAATATTVQSVRGIIVNGASTLTSLISGNLIANMTSNIIATGTQANAVLGIVVTTGAGTVFNNTIRNLISATRTTGSGASSAVQGILYTSTLAPAVIEANKIYNLTSLAPSTAAQTVGITYAGPTTGNNKIAANQIYSNTMISTAATAALLGIVVNGGVTSIYNNAIALGNDSMDISMNNSLDIRGITEVGGTNTFYFNTVSITGTAVTNTTSTYAFYSNLTSGTRVYKNNVFSNQRSFDMTPTTTGNYAALIGGTVTSGAITGLTCNYNLYYANGVGGAAILNGLTGTAYPTLLDWTSVATTHDINSVTGNPNFTSNQLLRGMAGTAMVNGDNTTGITTDITGATRVNHLMGAYDVYFTIPVKLYSFTAKAAGKDIVLNWATASEINNNHFEVERSVDRTNWETITRVKGAGTTNKPTHYNVIDQQVNHTGYVYYRLKQVDHDGAFEYSKTVAVWLGVTTIDMVRMYPNPVNTQFTIETNGKNLKGATITIVDLMGKTVYTSVIENEQPTTIGGIESLSPGTYILHVSTENETSHMKFLKQ